MKSFPNFGIIGAGGIGRIHLEALRNVGLNIVAIADPLEAAREQARAFAPKARLYADWRELLQDPEVDAVNICTINSLHFEILRASVAAGKHVFCEKTLTVDGVQAREALRGPIAPGQIVQAGYMKRFFPASRWARERLGEIGQPICATVRSFQGGWLDESMFDDPAWKPGPDGISRTQAFASGGMLNMAGSHMLDMTAWLLGEPESVACRTWSPPAFDAELHAHALFKMCSGVLLHFEAALSNFSRTGFYENGWDEFIQIDGTKGRLEIYYPVWNRPTEKAARVRLYREASKAWEEPTLPIVNPFQLELETFAKACRKETSDYPTLKEGILVDLWIDACYRSAASGQTVLFLR